MHAFPGHPRRQHVELAHPPRRRPHAHAYADVRGKQCVCARRPGPAARTASELPHPPAPITPPRAQARVRGTSEDASVFGLPAALGRRRSPSAPGWSATCPLDCLELRWLACAHGDSRASRQRAADDRGEVLLDRRDVWRVTVDRVASVRVGDVVGADFDLDRVRGTDVVDDVPVGVELVEYVRGRVTGDGVCLGPSPSDRWPS